MALKKSLKILLDKKKYRDEIEQYKKENEVLLDIVERTIVIIESYRSMSQLNEKIIWLYYKYSKRDHRIIISLCIMLWVASTILSYFLQNLN